MLEGVHASGTSAGDSHRFAAVFVPSVIGLAALAGYWTASGSHSAETLLICGLGLCVPQEGDLWTSNQFLSLRGRISQADRMALPRPGSIRRRFCPVGA